MPLSSLLLSRLLISESTQRCNQHTNTNKETANALVGLTTPSLNRWRCIQQGKTRMRKSGRDNESTANNRGQSTIGSARERRPGLSLEPKQPRSSRRRLFARRENTSSVGGIELMTVVSTTWPRRVRVSLRPSRSTERTGAPTTRANARRHEDHKQTTRKQTRRQTTANTGPSARHRARATRKSASATRKYHAKTSPTNTSAPPKHARTHVGSKQRRSEASK